MLNIVVCEKNKGFMTKNVNSINIALAESNMDYRICKYDSVSDNFEFVIKANDGKKIYILDEIFGVDVIHRIREYDSDSIIIITMNKDSDISIYNSLMIFDYVFRDDNYERRLIDTIRRTISVIEKQGVFTFKYKNVLHRIPYNEICYIEKESGVKRCIIHTISNDYYIICSISSILVKLNKDFCKTHQSCIVNLNNISEVDLKTNTIIFKNGDKTDMLTVKMKKEIKAYMGINK